MGDKGPWGRAGLHGFLEEEVLPGLGPGVTMIMKDKGR